MKWKKIERYEDGSFRWAQFPLEKMILINHKHGVEAVMFDTHKWKYCYCYSGTDCSSIFATATHFCIPVPPKK